jgi:hypothetical protein
LDLINISGSEAPFPMEYWFRLQCFTLQIRAYFSIYWPGAA